MNNPHLKATKKIVREFFIKRNETEKKFIPGKSKVPLAVPPYDWKEVCEAIDSLFSTQTTMGTKVKMFEELFARYIGVKHAIMVNSGSSANLLALSILTNSALGNERIKKGDEVITPSTTWVTTVYPIVNVGAKPVFVDSELGTYNIDPEKIEKAITKKTKAIMPVHLLGYPCDMDKINKIAKKHDLIIIEDSCESHGAEYHGKKVGSFGDVSTFSFFASHHITTMEGGMLLTNNTKFYELGKALRTFGWSRDLSNKESIAKQHPEIDPRYLFVNMGYNIRPTEIQGAFGIHQIKKLDSLVKIRIDNAHYLNKKLEPYSNYLILPPIKKGYKDSYLVYPITVTENKYFSKNELVSVLEKSGIETRPVVAGNIVQQPVIDYLPHKIVGKLKISEYVMKNSFVVGIHQNIDRVRREYMADTIIGFLDRKIGNQEPRK